MHIFHLRSRLTLRPHINYKIIVHFLPFFSSWFLSSLLLKCCIVIICVFISICSKCSLMRRLTFSFKRFKNRRFYFLPSIGFPDSSVGKESTRNAGDLDLIPGLGRSSGEWKVYPLQDSGLENSMDSIVHGVTKGKKLLSNFHFHFLFSWFRFNRTMWQIAANFLLYWNC